MPSDTFNDHGVHPLGYYATYVKPPQMYVGCILPYMPPNKHSTTCNTFTGMCVYPHKYAVDYMSMYSYYDELITLVATACGLADPIVSWMSHLLRYMYAHTTF